MTDARSACLKLLEYCRAKNFAGHDPYDALNSRIFTIMPFLDSRVPRLIATQTLKRAPINIRPLMMVPPTQNPKAIALFLSAILKLRRVDAARVAGLHIFLIDRLVALRSPESAYWAWGYSFPWQTRTEVVPRGTSNLVCTTFVAGALLDAYEQLGESRCLTMALSSAEYLVNELYRADGAVAGFSYPLPTMTSQIHNANFLGAALLCRIAKLSGDEKFIEPALKVARYSASRQRTDGSWPYGEASSQQWIDNFHTGYNLGGLQDINRSLDTCEFEAHIRRGFDFYLRHFFLHDKTYPIDIHCVAQSIITLTSLRERDSDCVSLANRVLEFALRRMWDERGFFYYRVLRFATIRTSYMRWSQAWMLLALATLLTESSQTADGPFSRRSAVPA
jgi:hypothetical protein